MLPISVFIIAKNEADRIVEPIKSVIGWVDEVIVIDSGSEDNTIAVSREAGAQVVYHPWQGYGPQKIFGESLCRNQWLLNIDADETVSAALAAEIQALFANGAEPPAQAYHVPIKITSRFEQTPKLFAPSNDPIRFYHRAYAGFKNSSIHDSVVAKDATTCQISSFRNVVLHRCFRSYRHAVEKINFYSSMQAEDMVGKGRRPSALRLVFEPLGAFLKAYFPRRYCLLGVDGFVESFLYAFARTLRLAKARELYKEKGE